MDLNEKVVWVTGAGKRLGRAMALAVARRGAHVAVHYYHSEAEAQETCAQIEALGARALPVGANLISVDAIKVCVESIEREFGRLDVLVNNASTFIPTPLENIDEAAWDASLGVNLKAPAFCALEAARLMRRNAKNAGGIAGKIVNMADSAAERPYRGYLPYMIAKGGIATLTRALALELAPEIAVNAIAPGPVLLPENYDAAQRERAIRRVPMAREGAPEDVVAALLWILEGGDFVTGQIVNVDGGRSVWAL